MSITEEILEKRADILRIAAAHHATDVRLIGSVARGEAGPDSDVDLVVHFLPAATAQDHAALVDELAVLLGRKVEVISEAELRESTRSRLPHEALTL
ncbi:MAG: nucleotidyltransferase family protein [Thermoleophilia bacterium]